MESFWPTPAATQSMPVVAERMNNLSKVVFSRTLKEAAWNNTRLVKKDMLGEVRKMKQEDGENMVIFGSGNLISQLAPEGLIDEYQIIIDPVVLGKGRTMFEGMKTKLPVKLTQSRTFKNGNVLLYYVPT
jgi:dihydrofolate reductase